MRADVAAGEEINCELLKRGERIETAAKSGGIERMWNTLPTAHGGPLLMVLAHIPSYSNAPRNDVKH